PDALEGGVQRRTHHVEAAGIALDDPHRVGGIEQEGHVRAAGQGWLLRRILVLLSVLGLRVLFVLLVLAVLGVLRLVTGERRNLGARQLLLFYREAGEVRGCSLPNLWHAVAGLQAQYRSRWLAHGRGLATSRPHAVILRGWEDRRGVLRDPCCGDLGVQLGLGRRPNAQFVVALRALLGGHGLLVILRHR